MRIAVTGGAGFIGQAVIQYGQAAGHDMISLDRSTPLEFGKVGPADVRSWASIAGALDGIRPDHVIHLAGVLGTSELFDGRANHAVEVNVGGALNVIQWCTKQRAGYTTITMPDSGWANVYAATKGCAVQLAEAYRRHQGLKTSNVCAFNAYGPAQKYGPGHPQKIIPTFASRAWAGLPIQIWGDGEQTVDLVHADDVAKVLVAATQFGGGEIFDAGTGHAMTVNDVADIVASTVMAATDGPVTIEYLPMRAGEDLHTQIVASGRGWGQLPADVVPQMDFDRLRETILSYRSVTR